MQRPNVCITLMYNTPRNKHVHIKSYTHNTAKVHTLHTRCTLHTGARSKGFLRQSRQHIPKSLPSTISICELFWTRHRLTYSLTHDSFTNVHAYTRASYACVLPIIAGALPNMWLHGVRDRLQTTRRLSCDQVWVIRWGVVKKSQNIFHPKYLVLAAVNESILRANLVCLKKN